MNSFVFFSENLGQLVIDDLNNLLSRIQGLRNLITECALTDGSYEVLYDLKGYISLKERPADIPERGIDITCREPALASQVLESV